jgi:hypothetical protein
LGVNFRNAARNSSAKKRLAKTGTFGGSSAAGDDLSMQRRIIQFAEPRQRVVFDDRCIEAHVPTLAAFRQAVPISGYPDSAE